MNDKQLLKRAAQQLTAWHEKYGANRGEWLPPAGDVRLLEDIDASLLSEDFSVDAAPKDSESVERLMRAQDGLPVVPDQDVRLQADIAGDRQYRAGFMSGYAVGMRCERKNNHSEYHSKLSKMSSAISDASTKARPQGRQKND